MPDDPDPDRERVARRHLVPIIGMGVAVIVAVIALILFITAGSGKQGEAPRADPPAQPAAQD